jgi:hypothetical protein
MHGIVPLAVVQASRHEKVLDFAMPVDQTFAPDLTNGAVGCMLSRFRGLWLFGQVG